MTRADAFLTLSERMKDAVNYADFIAWLNRQPTDLLVALAEGKPVPGWRRELEEVA